MHYSNNNFNSYFLISYLEDVPDVEEPDVDEKKPVKFSAEDSKK